MSAPGDVVYETTEALFRSNDAPAATGNDDMYAVIDRGAGNGGGKTQLPCGQCNKKFSHGMFDAEDHDTFYCEACWKEVFDDDNSPSKTYSGPTVPGGHTAFTRTATVYSTTLIGAGDLTVESDDPITEVLRNQVAAFTQRVGNCYLVEANILGFAGVLSGLKEEQAVLSNALKWALADYGVRFGKRRSRLCCTST